MRLLYTNSLKAYVKILMFGGFILAVSLPSVAADYCYLSDSQTTRKNQLASQHKLSITSTKIKANDNKEENTDSFTINKNGKVLYQNLIELCVTKQLDLIAKKNNKIGVINAAGQLIIPFMYDSIYPYGETFVVEKEWLFGLVDRQNQPLSAIEYYFADYTLSQAEENPLVPLIGYKKLGIIEVDNTNKGAWGSIDSSGSVVIPFIYDEISTISSLSYEETTGVYKVKKEDYWGLIDNKGELVLPIHYQKINWFNAAKKLYLVINNNQTHVIDANQNVRINGDIEDISFIDIQEERKLNIYDYDAHDGTLRPAIIRINDKYGLFDSNAKQKLPAEYNDLSYFYQDDLLAAKKDDLHGVVNTKGDWIIPLVYDELEAVYLDTGHEDLREVSYFIAKKGANYGLLSLNNDIILPFEYQSMNHYNLDIPNRILASRVITDSLNSIDKNNVKFALLTADGKSVTPFIYDKIVHDNYDSRIHVWQKGKEGVIDIDGQILLAPLYQSLDYDIVEDGYIFKREGLYGWLTDSDYKEVIPAMYDEPFEFEEGVATVIKDGVTMSIDKQGEVITP